MHLFTYEVSRGLKVTIAFSTVGTVNHSKKFKNVDYNTHALELYLSKDYSSLKT